MEWEDRLTYSHYNYNTDNFKEVFLVGEKHKMADANIMLSCLRIQKEIYRKPNNPKHVSHKEVNANPQKLV